MSEIRRRIAKAIAAKILHLERDADGGVDIDFEDVAGAVLEAMREPTLEMTKAAWSRYEQGHIRTAWRLMIDEALK